MALFDLRTLFLVEAGREPARGGTTPRPAATAAGVRGQVGDHVPRGADALFLLVFNDPEAPTSGYGLGWTLSAYDGSTRCWSLSLAVRGAGVHAEQGRAEFAAASLLAERGVRVTGWHHGTWTRVPMARAAVTDETLRA